MDDPRVAKLIELVRRLDAISTARKPLDDEESHIKGAIAEMLGAGNGTPLATTGLDQLAAEVVSEGASKKLQLLTLLRKQPGRDYGELTAALYRDDTPANRTKLRSVVAYASRIGQIEKMDGPGRWRLTEKRNGASHGHARP